LEFGIWNSCVPFQILNSKFRIQNGRHFRQLPLQKLAEQRTGVDAGKKVAGAAGSPVGAGVVTELGMVKRQLHERGHRHRTAFTD